MAKPVIAIDIDDVLADENSAMHQFINNTYGHTLTLDDYDIVAPYWGYWEKVWKVSEHEGARRFQAYIDSGIKRDHDVIPGAIDAIKTLQQKYDLVLITARVKQVIEETHEWLDQHFPDVFKSVEFVELWSGDYKASKADIAHSLNANYLIDDNAEHCRLAAKAGITGLLFGDFGWNRSEKVSKGVVRVKDWQAVLEYFDGQD